VVIRTALLLRVLEEREDIVADDDTGLAGENVFGTHCVGGVRIEKVVLWYMESVDFAKSDGEKLEDRGAARRYLSERAGYEVIGLGWASVGKNKARGGVIQWFSSTGSGVAAAPTPTYQRQATEEAKKHSPVGEKSSTAPLTRTWNAGIAIGGCRRESNWGWERAREEKSARRVT
jgi:hypothetical protein